MEYYIYEDDEIGREIKKVLIEKAKERVTVRFIYDDFGNRSIRKKLVCQLRNNGVKAFPFLKVYFILFANRLYYRNHRKIIVIDGQTAFVGGINVSDRYINDGDPKKLYCRDTHCALRTGRSISAILLHRFFFSRKSGIKPATHCHEPVW